jgi:hypothetical protein
MARQGDTVNYRWCRTHRRWWMPRLADQQSCPFCLLEEAEGVKVVEPGGGVDRGERAHFVIIDELT